MTVNRRADNICVRTEAQGRPDLPWSSPPWSFSPPGRPNVLYAESVFVDEGRKMIKMAKYPGMHFAHALTHYHTQSIAHIPQRPHHRFAARATLPPQGRTNCWRHGKITVRWLRCTISFAPSGLALSRVASFLEVQVYLNLFYIWNQAHETQISSIN